MLDWLLGSKKNGEANSGDEDSFLPPDVVLDETVLKCNGVGVRKRFGVSVYKMAVYLPQKTKDASAAIYMPGIKQIRLLALRNIGGDTLASAFLAGIRKNAKEENQTAYLEQLGDILSIFKTEDSITKGQTFHIDLLPEKGAFFYINEEQKGAPICMPGFNEAILSIWLGDNPVDEGLKEDILAG